MCKSFYSKYEVIEYLSVYSRFYAQRLFECEELFKEEKGYVSITMLFSILESIMKLTADDYDSPLYEIAKKLKDQSIISESHDSKIITKKLLSI